LIEIVSLSSDPCSSKTCREEIWELADRRENSTLGQTMILRDEHIMIGSEGWSHPISQMWVWWTSWCVTIVKSFWFWLQIHLETAESQCHTRNVSFKNDLRIASDFLRTFLFWPMMLETIVVSVTYFSDLHDWPIVRISLCVRHPMRMNFHSDHCHASPQIETRRRLWFSNCEQPSMSHHQSSTLFILIDREMHPQSNTFDWWSIRRWLWCNSSIIGQSMALNHHPLRLLTL
jgi:hypothetical protein